MKPQTQIRCGTDSKPVPTSAIGVCLRFVSPEDAGGKSAGELRRAPALFLFEEQGGYHEDRVARGYGIQNRLVGIKREGNGRGYLPVALSSSSYN